MYKSEPDLASFRINVKVCDNFQYMSSCGNAVTKKKVNRQSLKMIMFALKMIKEATGICIKARNILDMNYLDTPANASNKSREFLKQIFENISHTEVMVNGLCNSSSILVQKDLHFVNKMFDELNVYLEMDLLSSVH